MICGSGAHLSAGQLWSASGDMLTLANSFSSSAWSAHTNWPRRAKSAGQRAPGAQRDAKEKNNRRQIWPRACLSFALIGPNWPATREQRKLLEARANNE